MAWGRCGLGSVWPGDCVAWDPYGLGTVWPGIRMAWGCVAWDPYGLDPYGLGTVWPGIRMAWGRCGLGSVWPGDGVALELHVRLGNCVATCHMMCACRIFMVSPSHMEVAFGELCSYVSYDVCM